MHNKHDVVWNIPTSCDLDQATLAVLMDIRHQLQELNRKVDVIRHCPTVHGALQGALEVGRDIRRKQRAKRKRSKTK